MADPTKEESTAAQELAAEQDPTAHQNAQVLALLHSLFGEATLYGRARALWPADGDD
ncbi:MAG: hypothetical protein WKG07_02830 [Hymenobacter sp.]